MTPEAGRVAADDRSAGTAACRTARFEALQRDAEAAGLLRYEAWCAALERRYTAMPPWYWDPVKRRAAYSDHVRASIEWQQSQARINTENRRFLERLRGEGAS